MEEIRKSYKWRKRTKKIVCSILTLAMLVQYLPVSFLRDVFAANVEARAISVSFLNDGSGGNLKPAGVGNYLLSTGEQMSLYLKIKAEWNDNEGYDKGTKMKLKLPWFYYSESGVILQTFDRNEVIAQNPDVEFIGGVEAKLSSTETNWVVPQPTDQEQWGSDKDGAKAYRRQQLEIQSTPTNLFKGSATPEVTFKFFTLGDNVIPENTSASIALGASYVNFYDSSTNEPSPTGYVIQPGSTPSGNEDKSDLRAINIVNSNLNWETKITSVSTPVLWDKYNYAVYKVNIKNTSEDANSKIDYFHFMLQVPNSVNNAGRGVLEQDMMAWKWDSSTGSLVPNTDISDHARDFSFGGKYGEGGALIWDVTGKDLSDWSIDDEGSKMASEYNYIYSMPGEIGVKIDKEKGGELKKDEERSYYVAVPYVNNFGSDYSHTVKLKQTIYFGGRDLAWSKDSDVTSSFIRQKVDFEHNKYVEENKSPVTKKNGYLGQNETYYLDSFKNTSNTPVFNSYAVDTLPEHYQFNGIRIEMNNNSSDLIDWFYHTTAENGGTPATSDPLEFITLKFIDDQDRDLYVSLKELGATVTQTSNDNKNIWEINDLDQKIKDYLDSHTDYQFSRDIKFSFKERIAVNETFDGRIAVIGKTNYLLEYENTLNTFYERWNWTPYTTAESVPGYDKQLQQIKDPVTAIIDGERAKPLIGGFGVYHDEAEDGTVTDIMNSLTNSSGEKYQAVSLADPQSAIRFEVGTGTTSMMIPSYLQIDGLLKVNSNNAYIGLVASNIYLSPDLLNSSKIKTIDLYSATGTKIQLTWSQLQAYLDSSKGSITIPQSAWQPNNGIQISHLVKIIINFDEFNGNIPLNNGLNSYVEINGTPNATGVHRFNGLFSTLYNDYPAVAEIGNIVEDVKTTEAILEVQRIKPKIEASANWYGQSSTNINSPLIVPNKNSTLNPTDPTYYQFKIGNESESAALNVHLTLDLLSVKNVDLSGQTLIKGFNTEKIVIKSGYDKAMTIDHIEFFDYDAPTNGTPTFQIGQDELANYIDSHGDIVIESSAFSSVMTRLKTVRIVTEKFEKLIVNNDSVIINVYGDSDSYNSYYQDKRLEASLLFEPVGPLYNDDDKKQESAAFSVQSGQLTISNDIYQRDVQSGYITKNTNTDQNEKTLGVPYARDFTYRVELWNRSLSILDDVDTLIELPQINDGGFHPTSIVIYEDLLKQYGVFEKMTFIQKQTPIQSLFGDDSNITMTYNPMNHTIGNSEKTYQLDSQGCFVIPIEDIAGDQSLESIMLTGQKFVINDGLDIKPFLEINGWADSPINTSHILNTLATHYIDGLRGLDNTKYTVNTKDTANAYISKLYYDTTIVAGYNDNQSNVKFTKTATPREHVRMRYRNGGYWNDNSELEVGYKGLGSYAVDFRQYLNTGSNLPGDDAMSGQEHQSMNYIKATSFNTAATVKMNVTLPTQSFEAYYLRIDERAKDYIDSIEVTRSDGSSYIIDGNDIRSHFQAEESGYGRINLLQNNESFSNEQFFKTEEENYYKSPDTNYNAKNPIKSAVITLKINQEETTTLDNGETKVNTPDYGTWWNDSDESTKYMFEFAGRFYKVGQAKASVSSSVIIGSDSKHNSIERQTTGTSSQPSGNSWSFRNYYQHTDSYGWGATTAKYKADDLYSNADVVIVRDFNRILKGATTDEKNDYNIQAKIGDSNQYYINFSRASRTANAGFNTTSENYESGVTGNWVRQDPDDWSGRVGYTDHVSINDTLGLIEPDETYEYRGTLTTGLDFHKQIVNYMHEDKAIELVLGTGKTQALQNTNKQTILIKKSDLVKVGDYYTLQFDNSADQMSDEDAAGIVTELKDGVLHLKKHQYILSFRALLWDIQGNGEYLSEIKNNHYNYVDADGNIQNGIDGLGNANDIIVRVKPYMVYENNSTKIAQATNTATTKTYHDYDLNTGYNSYMFDDWAHKDQTYDSAYIMGYRIPFKAGHNIVAMGKTPIDSKDAVTADGNKQITDYLTSDGHSYEMLNGQTHKITQNITPTNVQFGVKLYNQTVNNPTDRSVPARIKKVVTDDALNEFYRLRNLYIPIQWIYKNDETATGTEKGQWFKMSQIQMRINGKDIVIKPNATGDTLEVSGLNLLVTTIPLDTIKSVNGQNCYVINMEEFARKNYTSLVTEQNGLAKSYVASFKITLEANNPLFTDDTSVLSNGEYLTASKTDGYTYFYDGTYVDRPIQEFKDDSWTANSVPTFGQTGNEYSPYSNSVASVSGRRQVYNYVEKSSVVFSSIDNNADTYSDVTSANKLIDYNLRNAVSILEPELTKKRGTNGELFAYDKVEKSETSGGKQTEVDLNHLMPYDYIEYTLSSKSHNNSEIPLERNHLTMEVEKGQQIVGWQLILSDQDSENIIDKATGHAITADDISVTLSNGSDKLENIQAGKDYSLNADQKDSHYRKIELVIGSEGTQVQPGQYIKVKIITQLTDELKTLTTTFEDKVLNTNAYIYAEAKHGYAQYAIEGYNSSDYTNGGMSNNGWDLTHQNPNPYTTRNDISNTDKISYFRYQRNDEDTSLPAKSRYNVRMHNTLKYYDNDPLTIEYKFDRNDRLFEGQGATLTVKDIKNDTMHFVDEQTVTVDFLDKDRYRGFTLTKIPTVSILKSEGGDIYYPDDLVTKAGYDNMKDIRVQYKISHPKTRASDTWVTVDYANLPDEDTMAQITAIRWTYFDVYSGYEVSGSPYKDIIEFDNVVLTGEGRYEDIRQDTDASGVMDDTYLAVSTANIDHQQNHVETKNVMVGDVETNIPVERAVVLNDIKVEEEEIYREVPQVILHPQVFDSENDASANYNETAQQKLGYRPEDTYWQKITLINREMVNASDVQNARQGTLINPTIYDKIPTDYVSVESGTLQFKWLDIDGNPVAGNYSIRENVIENNESYDYGGKMIYEKSDLVKTAQWKPIYESGRLYENGTKPFDDLIIDANHTMKTHYTVKTYTIIDNSTGKPITMNIGDTLIVYYQLKVAKDNLPMVYVDEDKDLSTTNDQHPAYFPRAGEYYQIKEEYLSYYGARNGQAYPFSNNYTNESVYPRAIQNSDRLMDMDYLLHDIGMSAQLNDNVDKWEFLKDSYVYIPGDGSTDPLANTRYGGGNKVLGDYDISSLKNMQKTIYSPGTTDPNGAGKDSLPESQKTSMKVSTWDRDWYEIVMEPRIFHINNWGSDTPIIWAQNRIHLEKAWLVSASEFVNTDPHSENRKYETTSGDGLTDGRPSNPNYKINPGRSSATDEYQRNDLHKLTDDNYEVALEYNEKFTTKLQALNYGDWDLSQGIEFTYTMPRGIEPLIFDNDGHVDMSKFKAEILSSINGVDSSGVNEAYTSLVLNDTNFAVEILQRPTDGTYKYSAPTQAQDPIWKTADKDDYPTGEETSPWVIKIIVKENLKKWFNRGADLGYKMNVYIPSHVYSTNDNEEWFDRLQTRPYVEDTTNTDHYYYQILDIDHWEGTTRENMQHNQRYGMDYMWYRGDGNTSSYYFRHGTYYYYNGSMNMPYINGYNIQNQEVRIQENGQGFNIGIPIENNYSYYLANNQDRYSQTGTRAVMRKPLLRQWTTVGDDKTGKTLSDYYLEAEGGQTDFNIHVENKYYYDELGSDWENYYSNSYATGSKEQHSYATDGGSRGTYYLPVVTNILPYGIAPVGVDNSSGTSNIGIFSTKANENINRELNWELLNIDGSALTGSEKDLYDVEVEYIYIPRLDEDGNEVIKDGEVVTEGRYVVRFYAKANSEAGDPALEAKIKSGEGRTFSFETFAYSTPKLDTLSGDTLSGLGDSFENNYTYISSKLDNFKALIDEDIPTNGYTVGHKSNDLYKYGNSNAYFKPDNRYDAIIETRTANNSTVNFGKIPNNILNDKITGENHYVIGQGMERIYENVQKANGDYVYNLEDYREQTDPDTLSKNKIRDALVLKFQKDSSGTITAQQNDFNMNQDQVHYDYEGSGKEIGDVAFVNTTKVRTSRPNLTLQNFVSANANEVGKQTPTLKGNGSENIPGSTNYTYDHDMNNTTPEIEKDFDYGDEVWYEAVLTNKTENTDYARQGSIYHSRFVFSYHLPDIVTAADEESWDQWRDDDFIIELRDQSGTVKQTITPSTLAGSGWAIRVINKGYQKQADGTASQEDDHTGQIITFELISAADPDFVDYDSYVQGYKPAGYLAYGDTISLKIRTRIDNKEPDGIDPSDQSQPDIWSGYYCEAYATIHSTNSEYIMTHDGHIYNDDERSQIAGSDTIIYDGYNLNKDILSKYDKTFTLQPQTLVNWNDKKVNDEKNDDGTLKNDYDQDGEFDDAYAYASSASIQVLKPEASIRIDTSHLRKRVSDDNASIVVIDDAHVRSADEMDIRITQAVNEQANVNQFIAGLNIPHRGTNVATSQVAGVDAREMISHLKEIRTGHWEVPDNYPNKTIYDDHLKVYVYGLLVNDPWSMTGYVDPNYVDSQNQAVWTILGESDGYNLDENAIISENQIDSVVNAYKASHPDSSHASVYQLKWVVTMEGFSADDGATYTAKEAAINYPVPIGLRMAIDSEGEANKEINASDQAQNNTDEAIMHHSGVVDNVAYARVVTGSKNISDGIAKHVNYFVNTYAKYDDYKYATISTSNRAGFYIDPELPTLQIDLEQGYFKPKVEEIDGQYKVHFGWDYDNSTIDDVSSTMLKYRVTMLNKKIDKDSGILIQDNATAPNITLALPYNEKLDTSRLQYVEYDAQASESQAPKDYLNDYYEVYDKNLDKETPLWTWYILDENGNYVQNTGIKAVKVSDDSPVVTSKELTANRKEKSKILNFYFTGELQPGENLKVEVMVPIQRMNSNAISAELLRCKAYTFKSGAFNAYTPDQGNMNSSAYEYDSQDINENGQYNDTAITKMTSAISFTTVQSLGQTKLVDTELESNVTNVPAAVNEGGDYTFKISSASLSSAANYKYTKNIIYDVLPYVDDNYVYQTRKDGENFINSARNSKWNGWIDINSLTAIKAEAGSDEQVIAPTEYKIWVGPLVEQDGKIVLNNDLNGLPQIPDAVYISNETNLKNLVEQDSEKKKYFVELEQLKTYLETVSESEKEELVKGIRTVWLQMKEDYTIQPSSRLELRYTMHAPQNVPKYLGTITPNADDEKDSNAQIIEAVRDFTGWNTFLSRGYSEANVKYEHQEETVAGTYVNAPTGRGYIGSYIWQDIDFNGKRDEGTYEDIYNIGRDLLKTPKYDLNNDSQLDDPGVNGVLVELLSENGRPVNKEGEAVAKESDFNGGTETGKYIVLDDTTGNPVLLDPGTDRERFRYSTSQPATYVSESDYYGNKGYYVFSNLKPGQYNMRYTLPKEYVEYSATTKNLNTANMNGVGANINTPVVVYRKGDVVYNAAKDLSDTTISSAQKAAYQVKDDTLVIQTAESIQVTAVNEDNTTIDGQGITPHQKYDRISMGYNLGIGRTNMYKGTTWLDETYQDANDDLSDVTIDGIMQDPDGLSERRLGNIRVEVYEADPVTQKPISSSPAITADGQVASYVTNENAVDDLLAGEYEFRLVPGKTYVVITTNLDRNLPLKPTAPIYSNIPTDDTKFNDLVLENKVSTTKAFTVPYIIGEHVDTWKDYEKTHTIDLGFVQSSRGFIGQIVWDDKNYNGIQDPDELGIEDVTVTLESYYYNSDTNQWIKLPDEKTVKTNTGGAYQFTVSTYYDPKIPDKGPYLMGYKVRIDKDKNANLFKTYAPTWQSVVNDGKQSDMTEVPNNLDQYLLTSDYVFIAENKSDITLPEHIIALNGREYDIGNAATKNYDAGLKLYDTGNLDGIVWLDYNYDGIRDDDEVIGSEPTPEEELLSKVKVKIKGYYYDGGVWKDAAWLKDDSALTLGTDNFYHYEFSDLPTSILVGGQPYLMGYKLLLDSDTIDEVLKPTLKYQGSADKDSHLDISSSKDYNLNKANEYIIVANEAKKHTETSNFHDLVVTVSGQSYDILQHQDISSYDAGLSSVEPGELKGYIWIDYNYDGIKNDTKPSQNGMSDSILKDIQVNIKQYVVSESAGHKVYTENTSFVHAPALTDSEGQYNFKNLPAYYIDDAGNYHLYAYQLTVDQQVNDAFMKTDDYKLGITKYHRGNESHLDSDWSHDGKLLHNGMDYLILLNKANDDTPPANEVLGYDIVKGKAYSNINAGAAVYQNGFINGIVFEDLDYDGLFNSQKDKPYQDVTVVLKQYYIDDRGEYIETGIKEEVKTNEKGEYLFDNLVTHGQLDNGDTVLYAYQISLLGLPQGYAVTKYHVNGENGYSHIDPKDNIFKMKENKNKYIILAKKSNDTTLAQYFNGYDLIEANKLKSFNGGLTKFHPGSISGYIFDDQNYDGIFNKDESGQSGINVMLSQYAKVPGEDEYIATGAIDFKVTDDKGYYQFNDLATCGLNDEDEMVLYAYRVTVNQDTLPEGYGITKYRVDTDERNSKLESSHFELISESEYQFQESSEPFIIIAGQTDSQDISYYQEGYDLIESIQVEELNGGISKIQTGEITGKIFDDIEYDGLFNDEDLGKEGIKVILKQFVNDPETGEYQETDFTLETITNQKGEYQFNKLKTYDTNEDGEIIFYYYNVYVDLESIPDNYAITKYQVQDEKYNNSDLIAETGLLRENDEYILFIQKTNDQSVQSQYKGFDLIKAHQLNSLDGGITQYESGKICGIVWLDASQTGKIDRLDPRLANQTVNLQRYYYKDGQWVEDLTMVKSATSDQNGYYEFNDLDSYVEIDEEKYLAGYQAYIHEVPSDMEVTEPFKNNGESDSKLLEAELRLSHPMYEKDGYMIVAQTSHSRADDINSSQYVKNGYDIVKSKDIDDMNAGFYQLASNDNIVITITADDTTLIEYCILAISSFVSICVIAFKKRKED